MEPRQLFVPFPSVKPGPTLTGMPAECLTTVLPADGVLELGHGIPPMTLTHAAVFQADCPTSLPQPTDAVPVIIANSGTNFDDTEDGPQFSDFRDPFYASTFPVCYALAATTVTAYMLVIMLFITPRSFLDGGVVYLGRRGFTSGSTGGVSIGGRPWLQKVAALTVAISLTIASDSTFKVAERQYSWGVQNAQQLQLEVMEGTELKIIRLISDTFLWLAQAQTLIRLFPRQREKVIIKWTAFALITLDVIFSSLNSFMYSKNGNQGNTRPRSFVDAIPALSYLFQLSLGLLYAAWVIYYSLMKKRYAFYHPLMKNMCLVSLVSLFSILVPVVFFILDISKPEFTGWGDYVRWVGAAAASVVVWEWVERIEALEREEKKDGILGREVFDGDEMLEISASEFPWLRRRKKRRGGRDDESDGGGGGASATGQGSSGGRANLWHGMSSLASRRHRPQGSRDITQQQETPAQRSIGGILRPGLWPSRPRPTASPVSRTDTASAASTMYAVRFQPMSEGTARTPDPVMQPSFVPVSRSNSGRSQEAAEETESPPVPSIQVQHAPNPTADTTAASTAAGADVEENNSSRSQTRWRTLARIANPVFRKAADNPPAEVVPHRTRPEPDGTTRDDLGRWDLRARIEDFAAAQAERFRDKMRPPPETDSLPVTVIPAPPRRGAALAQLLEEEEEEERASRQQPGMPTSFQTGNDSAEQGLQRSTSHVSTVESPLSNSSRDGNFVAPPMWPGVNPRYEHGEVSRESSVDLPRRPTDEPR